MRKSPVALLSTSATLGQAILSYSQASETNHRMPSHIKQAFTLLSTRHRPTINILLDGLTPGTQNHMGVGRTLRAWARPKTFQMT